MICISILSSTLICYGQVSDAAKKLAQESETFCASTASTKPTPEMIISKVNEACVLVEKEGTKSFSKFKGKNSTFIFAGTYIWINDLNGKMLMHPIKPGMEGQDLIGLKDSNGKRFFVDMITIAKEKGSGWVDYLWPKPGSSERSTKVSYVKKTTCNGLELVVGCGVYDMTIADVSGPK
jgi:signal transduction histidine kinase